MKTKKVLIPVELLILKLLNLFDGRQHENERADLRMQRKGKFKGAKNTIKYLWYLTVLAAPSGRWGMNNK